MGGLGWSKAFEAECLPVLFAWPANNMRPPPPPPPPPQPIQPAHPRLFQICQIPADDFVGEQNPLHLRVFDMVAPLILDNLKQELVKFPLSHMKNCHIPLTMVLFAPSLWP